MSTIHIGVWQIKNNDGLLHRLFLFSVFVHNIFSCNSGKGHYLATRANESGQLDQASGLLGISILPREGTALDVGSGADRNLVDKLICFTPF